MLKDRRRGLGTLGTLGLLGSVGFGVRLVRGSLRGPRMKRWDVRVGFDGARLWEGC